MKQHAPEAGITRDDPGTGDPLGPASGLQFGRMLARCARCDTANSPERKFCAGCGAALWEPCLACGATNGAWEKFCGVCGSNLDQLLQAQVARVQQCEAQARSFQALCRHADAIHELKSLAASQHPRLAAHIERAHQFAETLRAELEQLEIERDERYDKAREAVDKLDFQAAVAQMERVHRRLRTSDMQRLLDRAREALDEAAMLDAEIREAVASRNVSGLLVKVRRLLELRPGDAPMQSLAVRLEQAEQRGFEGRRGELVKAAQAKLAVHAYDDAARLLEQIHESVRTPEIEKLLEASHDRAAEVAWLIQDLREPAVLDDFVPSLCDRLARLKPKDQALAKFVEKIRGEHQERKARHQPGRETMLVRGKRETSFGFPVDALVGFRRIGTSKLEDVSACAENPGSFYVAAGLALQAIERSAVNINLLPAPKQNTLRKLAGGLLKKRWKGAWGLDVGTYSTKAVRLTLEAESPDQKSENRVVCTHCEMYDYPLPLNHPDVEPEATLRKTLERFLDRHKVEEYLICVGYPGQKTLARFVKLPPADKKKLAEMIKHEARQQIPFDLESVTWGYQTTSFGIDTKDELREQEAAIFALRTHEAEQFLFAFHDLLKIDLLQADGAALYNYLHFDRFGGREAAGSPSHEVIATLDLGAESSNLVIGNRDCLWLRNIPIGSNHFNRTLVSELNLTLAQAEQLKRNPLKHPLVHKVYKALHTPVGYLTSELRRSLSYYEYTYRERPIKQLYVAGGGARLHGLIRLLRSEGIAT